MPKELKKFLQYYLCVETFITTENDFLEISE